MASVLSSSAFERDGYLGPVPLLSSGECRALLAHLRDDERPEPAIWPKGAAVTDWRLGTLAADRRLMDLLTPLLGDDIILWGASLAERDPGDIHTWHVDTESASPQGRFVTAWIGLENCSGASGLRLIAGSHRCDKTVQEMREEAGLAPDEVSTETVLGWARVSNPEAHFVEPELGDGDAILFDGRSWHGSHNRSLAGTRSALLLQFASADSPVRVPFKPEETRAPAILVSGNATSDINLLVPHPARPADTPLQPLPSSIRKLRLARENRGRGWQPFPLFRGSTPVVDKMSCHAAVLSSGRSPHPPHSHDDEELLVVLDGEAELMLAHRPDYVGATVVPVKAGDFIYYPPRQHHTIRNRARSPVTYLMFRWNRPDAPQPGEPPTPTLYRAPPAPKADAAKSFATRRLLDLPTRWLGKLHCHSSRLEVGGGYAPHADPYDIAILMQRGRVRIVGHEAGPGDVIYCPAGDMHGIRNLGDEPAEYLVFEFHGRSAEQKPQVHRSPALSSA